MERRKTAGELTLKASSDSTKYDALEVGHALVEDNSVEKGLLDCIERHRNIFDEDEFCVGYVIASDPLIAGVMRRKYFAMLYLPSPRPSQAVFLYNKCLDKITKRLWVLPNAQTMEKLYLSNTSNLDKKYHTMKEWAVAFYDGIFWSHIRKQHNINMLSEHEYLNANREKLIQAGCKEVKSPLTDAFDFTKISVNKIVDTQTAVCD